MSDEIPAATGSPTIPRTGLLYTASQLEFLTEGPGPLGVAPIGIVKLEAIDTRPRCIMHASRARSTFLHQKAGSRSFLLLELPSWATD
jgi:hypothetical protein